MTFNSTGGGNTPSISASNVDIAYDATDGSISYTINNPANDGVLTANTTATWLTIGTVGTTVPFTCLANENTTERTATVTLTYTYDTDQTVTKDVTVTQAAAPVIYDDIEDLFNAATSTATDVTVSFESWFVTGVSTNGKNVYVTDGTNGFVIFDNNGGLGDTYHVNDLIEGTTTASLVLYTGFAELKNVDATNLTMTSYEAPAFADVAMADLSGINTGALLHYDNLTCSVSNNKYYLSDGTTTLQVYNALYAFDALENGKIYNITGVYQQYNSTKEILPRSAEDIEEVVSAEPSITVANATVNAPYTETDGTLTVTYENITEVAAEVWFCNAEGTTAATYNWITAEVNNENNVYYIINANNDEARTAYFKVWAYDDEFNEVYSNLVTVNQAEYVAPTFAELPFAFDGGKSAIEETDGLYQEGLGSDYNSSPKLKFDNTDDWLLLQFNERPGTLTFNIKGNNFSSGSTSTFKVQISTDGTIYTDLATYTELGSTETKTFNNLDANVRFIRWIYTEKGTTNGGNVALGNIALAEYVAPQPSITVYPDEVSVDAEEHDGTLDLTYQYLEIESFEDFDIQFYDAEGNELDENNEPDWIEVTTAEDEDVLLVSYFILENDGEARSAYFKVYAMDDETNLVYSNLVTISQAAPVHNYAELPFEWNQFSSTPVGITNQGVSVGGNNYDYLKFDAAGDYIILHFNEQPGILTFDIKGNTNGQDLWEGEFKVQTSEDGETYTDIRYYSTDDELPTSFYSDQTIATLNKNVRYIKWIYVTKTKGNIAIDNINLAKPVIETIGYPFTNNQWYLIASPVGDVAPADVANMTTGSYALYRFYQQGDADGKEWINYKNSTGGGFELKYGNGYLYANQNAGMLTFTGATIPYMDNGSNVLPLEYDEGADFAGYNLLGNPFNQTVWTDWDIYVMDENNNNIIPSTSRSIAPMQGFFVIAPDEDCTVTLYDNEPEGGDKGASVALNVSRNRGNVIDRAIVRMGEGRQLPKFQLFEGSTKVYIPQGDQDYAVVRSEGQGELPVNFRASENGTYSLSMDVENMDMNYLHLIDNMTGMDIDLLQTPSYTFEAKVNDYESRFRLVFAANNEDGVSTGSTAFAFFSNGNWIINNAGEATLQVVDLTGRILSSETVNGSVSKTINAVPGVYMLRLINGDNVNVQKIVVR